MPIPGQIMVFPNDSASRPLPVLEILPCGVSNLASAAGLATATPLATATATPLATAPTARFVRRSKSAVSLV